MVDFLPQIRHFVRSTASQDDEALRYAYDLMWILKRSSYTLEEADGWYRNRPSDIPADKLLAAIIRKRYEESQVWDWEGDSAFLDEEANDVDRKGIREWFPLTSRELSKITREHYHDTSPKRGSSNRAMIPNASP